MAAIRSSIRCYRLFSTTTTTTTTTTAASDTSLLTNSAVKHKFALIQDPDKALETYHNLLSEDNISPLTSRLALSHTVKCLRKAHRLDDIETLIESHKGHPKITQEDFFSTLIRSYGIANMMDNASRLFHEMEALGTPRTSVSFNALLYCHNMASEFDTARKLFDEIPKKYGIVPDKYSYAILIKSLCELKLHDSAISVVKEMESKNVEVTVIAYTTILDALYKAKKFKDAEGVWKEMIEKGCLPDVPTYNVRIMYAVYKGNLKEVLGLIEEIRGKGLKPDIITYNYLLSCYFKNGLVEEGEKVYDDLEVNGCSPNQATFKLFILHLCQNEKFEKANEVIKESVKRHRAPPLPTIEGLVKGLVKISKREEAKELIGLMKEKSSENIMKALKKIEAELGLSEGIGSSVQEEIAAASA